MILLWTSNMKIIFILCLSILTLIACAGSETPIAIDATETPPNMESITSTKSTGFQSETPIAIDATDTSPNMESITSTKSTGFQSDSSSINTPDNVCVLTDEHKVNDSKTISFNNYKKSLVNLWFEQEDKITRIPDIEGALTEVRNGPFQTLYLEALIDFHDKHHIDHKDKLKKDDLENLNEFQNSLCLAKHKQGTIRKMMINMQILTTFDLDDSFGWHPSSFEPFPYIETEKVIKSPSPPGLEHYTKYITASGVIIVGGDKVPDAAILDAKRNVDYMLSARPEYHQLLRDNETRISLFGGPGSTGTAGELPEWEGDNDEPGGFSAGVLDPAMTANADWLCYDGNINVGGNPVIHEMVHSLNHIVFESINETYFYERIQKLAIDGVTSGRLKPYEQHIEHREQNVSDRIGEFWAMTVEGYIMNREKFKDFPYDTRENIKKYDPNLYKLITRYFPKDDDWEYCSAYKDGADF